MKKFVGIGASGGIAIGKAQLLTSRVVVVDRWISRELVEEEIRLLAEAIDATDRQLELLSGEDTVAAHDLG